MSYKKLVRDKIPDIIKSNGEKPITRILSNEEYKSELEKKILEECNEVIASTGSDRIEELADVMEVMISLAAIEGYSIDDVIKSRDEKYMKRGGFENKIYLEGVIDNNN